MTRFIFISIFAALAATAEQYVYVDGGEIRTQPRALPSIGVVKATGQAVLGLHGATDKVKASCGWYRVTPAPQGKAVPTNQVVIATTYQIDGYTVRPVHTYGERKVLTLQDRVNAIFANRESDSQIAEVLGAIAVAVTNKLTIAKPIEIAPIAGGLKK